MSAVFIVNPAAGHGRGGARWGQARPLLKRLFPDMAVHHTDRPGHARDLARDAVLGGAELVVAVGGDGTVGEIVDGYLSVPEAARRAACLSTFPAGSGCDFARHMGISGEPEAWVAALSSGARRRVDAARATFRDSDGAPRARCFLNVAALGLPGQVAVAVARRGKMLGGALTYLLEGAVAAATAEPRRMRLVVDGVAEPEAAYHLVAAANTSTFGGGMRLAPGADAEDGLLELVTVADVSRVRLLAMLAAARSGGHVGREGVIVRRVRRVEISSHEPLPLNIDGDADGSAPAVFEALPKAVALRL